MGNPPPAPPRVTVTAPTAGTATAAASRSTPASGATTSRTRRWRGSARAARCPTTTRGTSSRSATSAGSRCRRPRCWRASAVSTRPSVTSVRPPAGAEATAATSGSHRRRGGSQARTWRDSTRGPSSNNRCVADMLIEESRKTHNHNLTFNRSRNLRHWSTPLTW